MSIMKSASLMLISGVANNVHEQSFKLLLLKRIGSSKSFPGKVVSPGGALDKCDYSDRWNGIIDRHFSTSQLNKLVCANELTVYNASKQLSTIMPQIFYRICAIRETFEETGVLLAVDSEHRPVMANESLIKDIRQGDWQSRVSSDANIFIDLLSQYRLSPDLSSLHEWSEWLSPPFISRRFHTAFFVRFVERQFETSINEHEAKCGQWQSPTDALDEFRRSGNLAPPQIAELTELAALTSLERVIAEAERRQRSGGLQNLSKFLQLSDGMVHVLPGDCRYDNDATEFSELPQLSLGDVSGDRCRRRFLVREGKIVFQSDVGEGDS